jgi:CO/xanthine dehydrogenase FAD-binding subunit
VSTRSIGVFEYKKPGSLRETVRLLKKKNGTVKILAGGTDLVLQIKQGQISPSLLLDVKDLPELNELKWNKNSGLRIGAAVPLSRLLEYKVVSKRFNILTQACSVIGSTQIRNRGTIGGNICNAAPSADSAPALLCLDAIAIIASDRGTHQVNLNNFFVGPGKTCIKNGELLVSIEIPTPPARSAGCYIRHTTREEMDIAVAGVGSFIILSPRSKIPKEVRIALGSVAPTPMRVHKAETLLIGKPVTEKAIEKVAEKAAEEARPISDIRASAEYRRELVKVLTRRTLRKSCEMLGIETGN